ncbi:MAG: alanine dehydrogenase [Candidatus Pacebacteria bacterium]|nr:alanine dehydrogenase [Candidatus Paceibacterota bacterium]
MNIGIPREVKIREGRVSCTPAAVRELVNAGHAVTVETGAGEGAGFSDRHYADTGATVVSRAEDTWAADMVVKVKEPVPDEYRYFRKDLALFTFLHLAANEPLTRALCDAGVTSIAYETVQSGRRLPLLEPMSMIAGRMSPLMGAYFLSGPQGGRGVLPAGVPGVSPANVLVLGGGTAGFSAARIAHGIGAAVTILEVNVERMTVIEQVTQGAVRTVYSTEEALRERLPDVDLVIGAVLIPGAEAPKLVTRAFLGRMQPGSVIVDIAIDQGGCVETSRPTTHDAPVYTEEGVVHYCVTNMPGAYARTATQALSHSTLPYVLRLANVGLARAMRDVPELRPGLNTHQGNVTYRKVADALGMSSTENPFDASTS